MSNREQEYRELFMAEALEYYDAMSRHISELERNPAADGEALRELFRLMHNLKSNARAMGYTSIGEAAHHMETVFGQLRDGQATFTGSMVPVLFSGIDTLGELIRAVGEQRELPDVQRLLDNLDRITRGEEPDLEGEEADDDEDVSRKLELSDLVYIQVRKLDHLMNLMGELIIDRDRILTLSREIDHPALATAAAHFSRIADELQYSVMDARLVGVGSLFSKFPRVVRDVATAEGKDVALTLQGEDIQIDRNILQIITDALLHLVRNAIAHGLETVVEREAAGKPAQGQLILSAQAERDDVLVQVKDDGRGIDVASVRRKAVERGLVTRAAAAQLPDAAVRAFLFEPGFSMAKQVTEISGRGVGLDVVKLAIDSLGGQLRVDSVLGEGTTFTLVLPTSIAVKGALLFELDERSYALPLMHTDSVVSLRPESFSVVGGVLLTRLQNENVPVVSLRELLQLEGNERLATARKSTLQGRQDIIIVNYNNRRLGLIVDRFLRQQDIVVKAMSKPLDTIDLFGGVTLLGSGQVCLVLDVPALTRLFLAKRP